MAYLFNDDKSKKNVRVVECVPASGYDEPYSVGDNVISFSANNYKNEITTDTLCLGVASITGNHAIIPITVHFDRLGNDIQVRFYSPKAGNFGYNHKLNLICMMK